MLQDQLTFKANSLRHITGAVIVGRYTNTFIAATLRVVLSTLGIPGAECSQFHLCNNKENKLVARSRVDK